MGLAAPLRHRRRRAGADAVRRRRQRRHAAGGAGRRRAGAAAAGARGADEDRRGVRRSRAGAACGWRQAAGLSLALMPLSGTALVLLTDLQLDASGVRAIGGADRAVGDRGDGAVRTARGAVGPAARRRASPRAQRARR
ncbi:MAG: hypothetical protein MZW92_66775 [Comamonadaceae bacterium]|nr:hypothetical protein [Comamonadaceae bacterium]